MEKTIFPKQEAVIDDFIKMDRDLRDLKTIFACVAWQQDDKTLHVPFSALTAMPPGLELEISVDMVHENWVFKAIQLDSPGEPRSVA